MKRCAVVLLGLAVCVAVPAAADVVVLRTGGKIEGETTRGDGVVHVRTPVGVVRVPAEEIERIEARETPQQEYRRRKAGVSADDIEGHRALAGWCRERRLRDEERAELREVIRLETDDADARRRLGFVRHDGRWMTVEESMAAQGLVLDGKEWVTAEEAERRQTERAEAKRKQEITKALQSALNAMASSDPKTRARGYAAAKATVDTYALPSDVLDWADRVKDHYDAAWAKIAASSSSPKVTMEIHATNFEFQGFRTMLINPPINAVLQLPYGTLHSYHGTVIVPAGSSAR